MISRAQKQRNAKAFADLVPELKQEGYTVVELDRIIRHFRITAPNGRRVDYWAGTTTWLEVGQPARGDGLSSMLAHLKLVRDGEPPAAPQQAPSGARYPDVTIFADASYDSNTHAAGWGAWMIRTGGKGSETVGGPIMDVGCSFPAECWAIVRAMEHAIDSGVVQAGDRVMLQSDCKAALDCILLVVPTARDNPHHTGISLTKASRIRKQVRRPMERIAELAKTAQIELLLRHVKGHSAGDGRNWVNRKVDEIAKGHMRTRRTAVLSKRRPAA